MAAMPADFFGSIYVERERAGDQVGWLAGEGISPEAWLAFLDLLKAEVRDTVLAGYAPEQALEAAFASAMQVGWVGALRWAAND